MGFSKEEYWGKLPFPPPGDLPDPGIQPASLAPPILAGTFFTTASPGKRKYCSRNQPEHTGPLGSLGRHSQPVCVEAAEN